MAIGAPRINELQLLSVLSRQRSRVRAPSSPPFIPKGCLAKRNFRPCGMDIEKGSPHRGPFCFLIATSWARRLRPHQLGPVVSATVLPSLR